MQEQATSKLEKMLYEKVGNYTLLIYKVKQPVL
jgi:hypothetical protein